MIEFYAPLTQLRRRKRRLPEIYMEKYTEEEKNLIVLSSFEELTYASKQNVLTALESFMPEDEQNGNLPIKSLRGGVYNKVRDKFYDPVYRQRVFQILEERGVECVTIASDGYPPLLKQIESAPLTLFLKGRKELLKSRMFAIVGSRRSTPYATEECKKLRWKARKTAPYQCLHSDMITQPKFQTFR